MSVLLLGRIQQGMDKEIKALEKFAEVEHMAKTCGDEWLAAEARKLLNNAAHSSVPGRWVFQSPGQNEPQELAETLERPHSYGASGSELYGGMSGRAQKTLDGKVVRS